jgi:C1A family cysteine protease
MSVRVRAVAVAVACAALLLLALPGATLAVAQGDLPQAGPLSPAFVESLHDPLAGVYGRRPAPVAVTMGAPAQGFLAARAAGTLPASYDLRRLGRLTPVRDQRDLGTCWAFGNLAAVESHLLPGKQWDFSEDNLVLRSGYGPFPGGAYQWGGWDFMAIAYLTRWAGPVAESSDPYGDGRTAAAPVLKHVQGAIMLPGRTGPLDNDLIKRLVMQNGALSIGMFYDAAFDSLHSTDGTRTPAYYCDLAAGDPFRGSTVGENHGVDIVGWDDSYPRASFTAGSGQPPGDGAFLVRNSWGASWGDHGYFWISYYDRSTAYGPLTSYSRVDPVGDFSRNYQYDTLGWTQSMGYAGGADPTLAWGANRFVAKATEHIAAAGFYATGAGTQYQVWAGSSLGSMTLRAQGTEALPGFFTVDLGRPLAVTKGKPFVVALRMVTPGTSQPIAVESRSLEGEPQTWLSHAVAKAGQSFMRNGDTDKWVDLALDTQNPDANVCLKAFARK